MSREHYHKTYYRWRKALLWRPVALYEKIRGHPEFAVPDFCSMLEFSSLYEPHLKELLGKMNGSLFVDVGAHFGLYSVLMIQHGFNVVSLEPALDSYACLAANTRNYVRVKILNVAAWNRNEILYLQSNKYSAERSIGEQGEQVQGIPLDALELPADIVKIDVEGSEPQVLDGMRDMLSRAHPQVIFEALDTNHLEKCTSILMEYGYQFQRIDPKNWIAQ